MLHGINKIGIAENRSQTFEIDRPILTLIGYETYHRPAKL